MEAASYFGNQNLTTNQKNPLTKWESPDKSMPSEILIVPHHTESLIPIQFSHLTIFSYSGYTAAIGRGRLLTACH